MAIPISNVTRRAVYAPTGTGGAGPYAFTFEILAATDIAVYKDDVLLTLTTHYTVTINANGTGSVTITAAGLALAPTSPTQYAIVGNRTIQRTTDFVTGGDFFANTVNDEMDQQTIFAQQNAEGLGRALIAPQTDPTTINMTLPRASLRAGKTLAFDSNGNPTLGDTLGTNRGNWASGTLYYIRDIVKDTSNNNIWQCLVQHTSSGSQPINTNTDSAKWTLLVDAASATTSATNAANSASAASTSASNASTSATNASNSATLASEWASKTNGQVASTDYSSKAWAVGGTGVTDTSSRGAAKEWATKTSGTVDTSEFSSKEYAQGTQSSTGGSAKNWAQQTGADVTGASANSRSAKSWAQDSLTGATLGGSSKDWAQHTGSTVDGTNYSAKHHATAAASSASAAANSASAASTSESNAAASAAAAAASLDNFDDRYLGAKSSNPTVDNDGNALVTGALYYRTTTPVGMKVYDGSQWLEASAAQQSLLVTYEYVATAGQTTFSGADANGVTLSYVANSISVSLNGAVLRPGDDYTASNGTSIVLTSAASLNDELVVIAFAVFNVANTYTQSQVDGFLAGKLNTTAGAVGTTNLADSAVTTAKIADSNVTTAKIADNNVTYAKLASDVQGALYGFKNRIINGGMVIDQRNAGASVNPTGGSYTLDRWSGQTSQSGKFSVQRNAGSVTPPAGFTNYLGVTSLSAYSVTSTDYFNIAQNIEGFNTADLSWGTANAQAITISFWARSSLTGTFGGALNNSGASRSYPFTYTISAANTWEQKTVTIAGDTSGTWLTDNGVGITVTFGLGAGATRSGTAGAWASSWFQSATGATSVVGTNGATFYITGVQLERGSTATSFDFRSYGTELALCQRYAIKVGGDTANNSYMAFGTGGNTTTALLFYYPPVTFRSTPSLASFSSLVIDDSNGSISISALVLDTNGASPAFIRLNATATGLTQFRPYFLRGSSSTGNLVLSAEL